MMNKILKRLLKRVIIYCIDVIQVYLLKQEIQELIDDINSDIKKTNQFNTLSLWYEEEEIDGKPQDRFVIYERGNDNPIWMSYGSSKNGELCAHDFKWVIRLMKKHYGK